MNLKFAGEDKGGAGSRDSIQRLNIKPRLASNSCSPGLSVLGLDRAIAVNFITTASPDVWDVGVDKAVFLNIPHPWPTVALLSSIPLGAFIMEDKCARDKQERPLSLWGCETRKCG